MTLKQFPGGAADIDEPNWEQLFPDEYPPTNRDNSDWRDFTHREWLRITSIMREAGTLGAENRHQIQRLIMAYAMYDRAASEVIRMGPIDEAPVTDVAKANIYISIMRHADADATTAEMELGITPRRRGTVTKAKRAEKVVRAADKYIKPMSA
jgi:phage terminase small subunit